MRCPYCGKAILTNQQIKILSILAETPLTAYTLHKKLETSYSNIHGHTAFLEQEGYLEGQGSISEKNHFKKIFSVTAKANKLLKEKQS